MAHPKKSATFPSASSPGIWRRITTVYAPVCARQSSLLSKFCISLRSRYTHDVLQYQSNAMGPALQTRGPCLDDPSQKHGSEKGGGKRDGETEEGGHLKWLAGLFCSCP
eukprot:scaffold56145_cov18-Tisochrysis_lutea.AAC.3